jgi:hypothetical protein
MSDDRLTIFEALLFGIYGNWLISFVDKITFLNATPLFTVLKLSFALFSFVFLIILVFWSLFQPQRLSKKRIIGLGIAHFVCNSGTLFFEVLGDTPKFIGVYGLFVVIGAIMFSIICNIQFRRTRLIS